MRPVFKLINSKLKFYHKAEAPSIPFPGLAYGYEETEDGALKKQEPPKRDTTLGPAFYNPYRFFDNSYKGCHFGNYTSSRGFYSISKVPGPGEYNITCAPSKKAENINTKQTAVVRYEAQIPRYLDAIVKKETKLSTPGPAEYIMKSQFDSVVKPETPFTEHPPFYSQAKRFTKHVNTNPAPGLYNDPRCALERIKKASCMKMSPFGQTSVRFQNDIDAKLLPE
ncbi:Hypothetical predicted protein [Octopus vulgaris]|uniref:Uncharacterized protein n=1 Tax=Octopus vulgaris TaxID=6645 RepID=A0AA36FLC9_OCTVU|nr:Hypothetical predicted protein [Octopus vulgaris]